MSSNKEVDQREDVILAIKAAIHKYGIEAGPKIAREQYPDVPRSTWYRYLKAAQASPIDVAVAQAKKASKHLPAAPSPAYIAEKPVEARKNIDMMSRLESLYADAEMLRAYAMTPDGERIRVPTFFAQSIKLRADLLETALKAVQEVWDLQRMQRFYDTILDEIGNVDPELQRRIVERLQELNEKMGLTMEARV